MATYTQVNLDFDFKSNDTYTTGMDEQSPTPMIYNIKYYNNILFLLDYFILKNHSRVI